MTPPTQKTPAKYTDLPPGIARRFAAYDKHFKALYGIIVTLVGAIGFLVNHCVV